MYHFTPEIRTPLVYWTLRWVPMQYKHTPEIDQDTSCILDTLLGPNAIQTHP